MNLINHTGFAADTTTASDKSGRKHLLLIIKATYRLPLGGEPAQLMDSQVAPVMADTATGEPGLTAPEYECEYVLTKPRCDVLLLGSAYAPHGKPVQRIGVGLKVGSLVKVFHVCGKRNWHAGLLGIHAGKAAPFTRQTISYDVAFGGVENNPADSEHCAVYLPNPVGIGYQKKLKPAWIDGRPMPQTEAADAPITVPHKAYQPMSFGPLGRHWAQRAQYAGTYDAHWEKEIFPFLPPDFDERYFQCAPEDQQSAALQGGEAVTLLNLTHPALTPSGRLDFTLPNLALKVRFYPRKGEPESRPARADTLLLEPDKQRFTVTWRIARPLTRALSEIDKIEMGNAQDSASASHTIPDEATL